MKFVKIKIVLKALLLLNMKKDLLERIAQHLCHMRNQTITSLLMHPGNIVSMLVATLD